MTLQEIADALISHCRNGTEDKGLNTLYADDVVSIEALAQPGGGPQMFEGLDALRGKHDYWNNAMEQVSIEAGGPYPHQPDKFALTFKGQATVKETGEPFEMDEIAIYTVKDGKIAREEFFYSM